MYDMVMEHFANLNFSVVCYKMLFFWFALRDITFMRFVSTAALLDDFFILFTSINGCCAG